MSIPGQYPQFDPSGGSGQNLFSGRPRPDVVRNAVWAMFAGAAVSVLNTAWGLHVDSGSAVARLAGGFGLFGGAVNAGLWIWMALANRSGHNWARITGTVFFGFASFSTVLSIALLPFLTHLQNNLGEPSTTSAATSGVTIALSVVSWLIGLYATVMMWRKSAKPFYQPQMVYGPAGWVPGTPPYGYPYPSPYPYPYQPIPYQPAPGQPLPGQPGAPLAGQFPLPPEQPADPWRTPQD